MTKPQIILSALALGAIGISAAFISSKSVSNPEHHFLTSVFKEKEEQEEKSIKGAMEYYKKVRANQVTGTIEISDIDNALNQVNALKNQKSTRAFETLAWEEAGPNNKGGRTRALLVDKDNANKIYMAGVGGGLWISLDNGNSWTKRNGSDSSASLAVVSIAQTANGDVYYSTGEGNTGFADFSPNSHNEQIIQMGRGIFKSTDGGNSFTQLPATRPSPNDGNDGWAYIDKIVAHPTDPQKIIAATKGGLRISSNGGTSWAKPTGLTSVNNRFCDVEISTDGNRILAATTSRVYISSDGGTSFALAGANGLGTGATRIDVAIAPSNPNTVYACMAGTPTSEGIGLKGIYKSIDGGQNWTTLLQGGSSYTNPLGDQGNYDIAFAVHPLHEDIVYCGGQLLMFRYTDGSHGYNAGWKTIASWIANQSLGLKIYADMHGVFFNPTDPETMYVVADGGLYRTFNSSAEQPFFVEKNKNYSTTQCYGIAVNSLGRIVWGSQDRGSGIIGTSANSSLESSDLTGGDGFRCVISDLNPNSIITSIYDGQLQRATDGGAGGGASFARFYDKNIDGAPASSPDGIPDENASANMWITPMLFNEKKIGTENKNYLVTGTARSVWMTQSPLIGNSIWFKLSKTNGNYSAFAASEDGKVIYAGTESGQIFRLDIPSLFDTTYTYFDTVTNLFGSQGYVQLAGITQTQIGALGRFVTDLSCTKDGESVVATLGNYANSTYVFRANNARTGATVSFNDITGNLPKMPVYTSILVNNNPNKIMIGTEFGIYGTDNGGSTWVDLNVQTPSNPSSWHPRVATYELVEKPVIYNKNGSSHHGSIIYSGTHGRGVFKTTTMATLWPTGVDEYTKDLNKITVYPNPAQDVAYINYPATMSGNVNVTLYSLTGTRVKNFTFKTINGDNKLELNIADVAKGAYIVVMNNGSSKETSTLLKN